jgi:hypothetical protein
MTLLKRFWPFLLLLLVAIGLLIAFLVSNHKATVRDETISDYKDQIAVLSVKVKADSVAFGLIRSNFTREDQRKDSIIKSKEIGIHQLIVYRDAELRRVEDLNAVQSVKFLSDQLTKLENTPIKLLAVVVKADTSTLLSIPYVVAINKALVGGLYCQSEKDSLYALNSILKVKIIGQKGFITDQDNQITNLRRDIDKCLLISKDENTMLEKLNKKIKNRNTWMGILGGAAIVGIGVAILK